MWMFDIESFKFPITVLIKDPSQDLFFEKEQTSKEKVVKSWLKYFKKSDSVVVLKHDDHWLCVNN